MQDTEVVVEEELVEEAVGYDDPSEVIHFQDTLIVNNLYLSLHALEGIINFQTMRVRGLVGKKMLCVLTDTKSTHNFINEGMASKLGCVKGSSRIEGFNYKWRRA